MKQSVHSRSAKRPQVLHNLVAAVCFAIVIATPATFAQSSSHPNTAVEATYRVFLVDGKALPSYGAAAYAGERVVFNLLIRQTDTGARLQLMSLPRAAVDVDRTNRYTGTLDAARYANTRGEIDYVQFTAEVARAIGELSSDGDVRSRLALAQTTRGRLAKWAEEHYHYRADDVQALMGLLDEVITELRIAAGEQAFSLDFVSGSTRPPAETPLPAPTLRDSVSLALVAADTADIGEDRVAILRTTDESIALGEGVDDLRVVVANRLSEELTVSTAYRALAADLIQRASDARQEGDAAAVERLQAELDQRDRRLGSKRPQDAESLRRLLASSLAAARLHRTALDQYEDTRRGLLAYEARVRPALSGLDGLSPVLRYIRDGRAMAFDRVVNAEQRLKKLLEDTQDVRPPGNLADVHATLVSALRMAYEANTRRHRAMVTKRAQADREASSAAAGALLLAERARTDLVASLFPPKPE